MAYGLPQGGQRIIVADRASRVTGREIVIPGLRSHPDALPAAPSPWDNEFDRPLTGSVSGTATQTVDSGKTIKSHLYMTASASGSFTDRYVYWPGPPTPFTVTAKLADMSLPLNSNGSMGLLVGSTGGATFVHVDLVSPDQTNATLAYRVWSTGTSSQLFSTAVTAGQALHRAVYLRMVVTSSTSYAYQWSHGGLIWTTLGSGSNPSVTPAVIGCLINSGNQSLAASVCFDWVRVTTP